MQLFIIILSSIKKWKKLKIIQEVFGMDTDTNRQTFMEISAQGVRYDESQPTRLLNNRA